MMQPYEDFLAQKQVTAPAAGFTVDPATLPAALFPWQRDIVLWALWRGQAALFEECGLGKTLQELAWAQAVARHTRRPVLILTPLAVAEQTVAEGQKFGVPVTLCESGADVQPGVNVTNYEKLHLFNVDIFGGVVLDESSILKAYTGKTKRRLLSAFARTPYRLAATATPSPNDYMELGNHSEFLGIMPSHEMLTRWFINNTDTAGDYRLKGHAQSDFWRWVSSWAVGLVKPSDLTEGATGQPYPDGGYLLPPLQITPVTVGVDPTVEAGDRLFRMPVLSATEQHREARLTTAARVQACIAQVDSAPPGEPWIIWCQRNDEQEALTKALGDRAISIYGSLSNEKKTAGLQAWLRGERPILISKPTICGFGLNMQRCAQMIFVGLSYSFEQFYQALRRSWRFGQTRPVTAYLIGADTEGSILTTLLRKQGEHERMQAALVAALQANGGRLIDDALPRMTLSAPIREVATGPDWTLHLGDAMAVTPTLAAESVGLSLFSPPFKGLYLYSPDYRDLGNCAEDAEFFAQFGYLLPELWRVTIPGRLCIVHCKDLPRYRNKSGASGLYDFPGALRAAFEGAVIPGGGRWVYHSRVTIWRDPVQERARTNSQRLLYKQLQDDASYSGVGLPDYLLLFRKWTVEGESAAPVTHTKADFPLDQWRAWASPVWFDVDPMNVLNELMAKENADEKHICPLQLDVIARCLTLWSNPGDLIFSPFAGIGSEGYQALLGWRRFVGIELKESYWHAAQRHLNKALVARAQLAMFPEAAPEPAEVA